MEQNPVEDSETTETKMEPVDDTDTDTELHHIVDAAYSSDVSFGPGFQQEADPIQNPVTTPSPQPKSILKNKAGGQPWRKKTSEKVDLACDICDLKFTSWVIANDHLNGKRHAKRLRMAQTNKVQTPVAVVTKPELVQPPVVKMTPEVPEKKLGVPSRTQYRLERLSSFKERTVIVWPITQQDLSNPKLLEVAENCCHWFCRFYSRDRVDKKSLGNLEIRFNTVADAEEGVKKLSFLRDEIKTGGDGEASSSLSAVMIQKLTANDTVDKAIIAMKGSFPKGNFEYRTVFVGSLPPTMTEEKLKVYFPTSTSVLIPRDENNVQKGYAYIEYDTAEQAIAVTNNMSSLNIDGETVSLVNFSMASEKSPNKPVKRPASPRAPGQAAQASSPAQPAAKKPAIAVDKQPLPAGAMSSVKRSILLAKLKSLKKNMRKNPEAKNNPELRKMLRNWHSAVQRDTDIRKKFNLPHPGPLPDDPDKEFGPIRRGFNWRGQGQDQGYPPAKRMKRGGGAGTGWQQRGGRFENRSWQNKASSADYNSNQTANAVNLLMGLTQALSGQANMNLGGLVGGPGRGSSGYQGKQGGGRGGGSLRGGGGLGGGLGASSGFQGKQQRMLPNLKAKGKKSQQGGSGGRFQSNTSQMMTSQSGQDGFGGSAVSGDGYGSMGNMGNMSSMATGQQDYGDGGYSGAGGYTDSTYANDYSMDTSNNSFQDNWDMTYNSGAMSTDSSQQTNRSGLGGGQTWW